MDPGRVRIARDEWGAPHVTAAAESDGFYGLGYAQAADDLVTLLGRCAAASGRLAAVIGPEGIDADLAVAQWDHLAQAQAGFARLPANVQRNHEAFLDGVAAYLRDHPDRRPAWTPALEPWLLVAASRWLLWSYMFGDAVDALRAAGVEPDELHGVQSTLPGASNQMAVAPARSAEGVAMLISDIHTGPDRKFEFTLHAGALALYGTALCPGALPPIGHNPRVAWAMTTGAPRVSDCLRLTLVPDADAVRYGPATLPVMARQVEIEVAGGDARRATVRWVELDGLRCPVMAQAQGALYVAATPYQCRAETVETALDGMARAHSADELVAVCAETGFYPQNVMAADVDGHIAYVRTGLVPVRAPGVDPSLPVTATPETAWRGLHPPSALVRIDDPVGGWMQNCNVAPDSMTAVPESRLAADAYAPEVFNDRPGRQTSRGQRVTDLLREAEPLSEQDWTALALDEYWVDVPAWQRVLAALPDGEAAVLRDRLLGFDGQARAESTAANLWWHWREALRERFTADPQALCDLQRRVLDGETPTPAELAEVSAALCSAGRALRERHGHVDVPLGAVFRAGDLPYGGVAYEAYPNLGQGLDLDRHVAPVRVMLPGPPDEAGHRAPVYGGFNLVVTVLGSPIRSYSAVLPGQSADPASPHAADRLALLSERRLRPTWFDPADLEGHVQDVCELTVSAREVNDRT